METGARFCVVCGHAADAPQEFSAARENAVFREVDGAVVVESLDSPPLSSAYVTAAAPQLDGKSGSAGRLLITAALGAMLFAALCAALLIFTIRATVGGGLLAALGGVSDTVAVAVGSARRAALFSDYALVSAAALCALLLFNVIMLNTARIRRAFLCAGAAICAAGIAFTAAGLLFGASVELPAFFASLMDWPVFIQFGDDAEVQVLRAGLIALAVAAPAIAAYPAARAARPGPAAPHSGGRAVRITVTAVVSAAIAAVCGWSAYMAFTA
jgi:hypothetical protein